MAYQGHDSEHTSQPQTAREESRLLESATRTIPLSKFFVSSDGSEDEDDDFIISSPNGELDYLMSDFNDAGPSIWVSFTVFVFDIKLEGILTVTSNIVVPRGV